MEALLALLASKIGPWVAVAFAAAGTGLGLWMQGRRSGRQAERDARARDRLDAIETAWREEDAVAAADPAMNREELSRWGR